MEDGKLLKRAQQSTRYQLFQMPVQLLPDFSNENENFNVCFLYPSNFKSFILEENSEKINERKYEDRLLIKESNQPIPVLLPSKLLDQLCENFIKITGTISDLPKEFENIVTSRFNATMKEFSYKYFRPYSPKIGFCIDCRMQYSSDFHVKDKIKNLYAPIYIEAHFQNFNTNSLENEMKSAIPDILPLVFKTAERPDITPYCTTGDIRIIRRAGNTYGFYTEVDLIDQEDNEIKLKKMQAVYNSFRKKAQQIIRNHTGHDYKFKPDFIYDYTRQKLFHPEGVLSSKEVELLLEKDKSIQDTINWLRQ